MADLATMQTWLTEAESARHQIAMGTAVVEVWRDGRRVTYSRTSLSDLDSYIDKLRCDIAAISGGTTGRRRSIGVIFGG